MSALREADCVLLAGVPCDFRLDYGRHVRRSATLIAVKRSRRDARLNRRPTIELIGDAGLTLEGLARQLDTGGHRADWVRQLRARDDVREREIDLQSAAAGEHVNPIAFVRALDRVAGDNAVMVADGGDFVATASYIVRPRGPLTWLDPGAFGTLGVGAGFALGAQLVRAKDEVWLIWGDGACGYGLVEFDTFVRHGMPVIAVVGNDASWSQIAREQVKMLGDDVATVLARSDYHVAVQGFEAEGIVIKHVSEIEPGLQRANRPYISIAPTHIAFNATFTRIAEISTRHRVKIYADPEYLRLGFEFHTDDRPNSLALIQASSETKGEKGVGLFCSARGLITQYPWVKGITELPTKDRRFYDPKKEGQLWVIDLCPVSEVRKARESLDIPSDAVGIYRYVREDGEIVFIGRGDIKKRLASPDRTAWDFDLIEYSIVGIEDEAWDRVIATNLSGAFRLCRAAAKYMILNRWGRIINLSSISGSRGGRGQINYSSSKAGIETMTRVLALEVGRKGVLAN